MSLTDDLAALKIAAAARKALNEGIPPCLGCGVSRWVAGKGGRLVCAECGDPVPDADNASPRDTPSGLDGAGLPVLGEGADLGPSGVAVAAGPGAAAGPEPFGPGLSANPMPGLLSDPVAPSGATAFSDVTIGAVDGLPGGSALPRGGVSRETRDFAAEAQAEVDLIVPPEVSVPAVRGPKLAPEVGVLRDKVQGYRRGTAQFYEDAKAAHRLAMRSMKAYIKKKLKAPGGVMSALKDPEYRWCVEQVGKYAHSQAPREIKAETKLLIEFDMG